MKKIKSLFFIIRVCFCYSEWRRDSHQIIFIISGRRPVPYFRGQYRPREPLPPPPVFPNTPALIGADPTLLLTPELRPELVPGPELIPQNIENPLAAGEVQSPEFTPQVFEIQTEPQNNLRPQVARPGQSLPEAEIPLDSR